MSTRQIADILITALGDKLTRGDQADLRRNLSLLEATSKDVAQKVSGGGSVKIASGNVDIAPSSGIQLYRPDTGRPTIHLMQNGDIRAGYDLLYPARTSLALFSNGQTYNGEVVGEGDLLLGDNTSGSANLFWDRSTGRLNFRGGTTANAYISSTGYLTATGATITGTITAAAGSIGGWSITTTEVKKTGLVLDSSADSIYVGASAPRLIIDGTNKNIRSSNFSSGLAGFKVEAATGNAEFNDIKARGKIITSVFEYQATQALAGSLGVFYSAGQLKTTVAVETSPTTTDLDIVDPESGHVQVFAVGDYLRMRDPIMGDNWLEVLSITDNTTYYTYTCVHKSGTERIFYAGVAVLDYGPKAAGAGYLLMSADDSDGPWYSARTWTTNPWTGGNVVERARIGNMNGAFGVAADYFGFGAGDYAGGNYLKYDSNGGFAMKAGGGAITLDANGAGIEIGAAFDTVKSYRFQNSSAVWRGGVGMNEDASSVYSLFQTDASSATAKGSSMQVRSTAGTGSMGALSLWALAYTQKSANIGLIADGSTESYISHNADYHFFQTGEVYIGDYSNAYNASGLTINQGGGDDEIITLKSDDVAHGMTTLTETDTYGHIKKLEATSGGLRITGFKDADGSAYGALYLQGQLGENADTSKLTTGSGIVQFDARVKSGTSSGGVNSGGNAFVFSNAGSSIVHIDNTGIIYAGGRVYADQLDANGAAAIGVDPTNTTSAGFWNATITRDSTNYCIVHTSGGNTFVNGDTSLQLKVGDANRIVMGTAIELSADIYSTSWNWQNYYSTSTKVGWSSVTDGYIYVKKVGKFVFVSYRIVGTSNSTSTSFTVPFTAAAGGSALCRVQDNSVTQVDPGLADWSTGTTITFYKTLASGTWTASGSKYIMGQFFYEATT